MPRPRVYEDLKEKQKAYRDRKKASGYRQISVIVPESIYSEIKGKPGLLVEAYSKVHKKEKRRMKK